MTATNHHLKYFACSGYLFLEGGGGGVELPPSFSRFDFNRTRLCLLCVCVFLCSFFRLFYIPTSADCQDHRAPHGAVHPGGAGHVRLRGHRQRAQGAGDAPPVRGTPRREGRAPGMCVCARTCCVSKAEETVELLLDLGRGGKRRFVVASRVQQQQRRSDWTGPSVCVRSHYLGVVRVGILQVYVAHNRKLAHYLFMNSDLR